MVDRAEVIRLGDALIVPEGKIVIFVKEGFDENGTEEIILGIDTEESCFFTYLIGRPRLHEQLKQAD